MSHTPRLRPLLGLAVVVPLACGPVVRVVPLGAAPAPARAGDAPVRVFATALPRCAFAEIATMTVEGGGGNGTRLLEAARTRTRALGGDAIVGLLQGVKPRQPGNDVLASLLTTESTVLSGTIVRFTDPACTE